MTGMSIRAMASALPGENGVKGAVLTGRDIFSLQFREQSKGFKGFFTRFISKKTLEKTGRLVDRLENKTGIKTRNILLDNVAKYPNTYLGITAAVRTLEKAGVLPSKVQGFYYSTDTPDFVFPAQGLAVAKLLGIKPVQFGNSSLACVSMAQGLYEASGWIDRELCDNALILLGDVTSRLRLPHSNLERYIFGDGFVGIFLEKGKGGFKFTNIGIDPEVSDVFVHNQIYASQCLNYSSYELQDNFQYNDAALDILGEIDAVEYSYGLDDYLRNFGEVIDEKVKIGTPQGGKNSITKGMEIFKENTGIDITTNVIQSSSYKHGNIGAGALALSMLEGGVSLDDTVISSIAGVGGVKTVFEINPSFDGIKTKRITDAKPRPDYREIVERSIEELRRKKRKGKFELSELAISDLGEIKFTPISHKPMELTNLDRVMRSISNSAAL
ncbi:MAG: hypothetical protein A3I68_00900 [Candidatus Melainabacteria bacterium RIFCSPLOWO2_02_FULL_35_15]|nr:MAG: hypothetical protein A3F80_09345 [Candidatus Melainabacteria bacterium RIFCSPLOWO2_12_FULL_35_11]OGI13338.1 MAG: hypothetical protein A3I68_00900 [Candidatus Melainabacteria bacterium RIFCSPLOWO2_02_FULL_35_15]